MRRRTLIRLGGSILATHLLPNDASAEAPAFSHESHIAWVAEALQRMQTIKLGDTREALLTVFTTEGGLSTGLKRTYAGRDCPFFKVDVEFEPAGRPAHDAEGRVTLTEDLRDRIKALSPIYLQWTIAD